MRQVNGAPEAPTEPGDNLQGREHIARADAIDANAGMRPFDGEASREVPHRRLRRVVGRLRLRDVDDAPRHAADHNDTPGGLALHQMFRHADREQVGPINIDPPQLLHPVVRVRDCIVVFGEPSGRN